MLHAACFILTDSPLWVAIKRERPFVLYCQPSLSIFWNWHCVLSTDFDSENTSPLSLHICGTVKQGFVCIADPGLRRLSASCLAKLQFSSHKFQARHGQITENTSGHLKPTHPWAVLLVLQCRFLFCSVGSCPFLVSQKVAWLPRNDCGTDNI